MATASVSSSTAVSALLQKASQQYLECRRKVTAKADEVKTLESEIQTLFSRITSLADGAHATKSVGRLELQIVAIEGEAPVDGAIVSVEIDPEYEEPEEDTATPEPTTVEELLEDAEETETTKEAAGDEASKEAEGETEVEKSEGEQEKKEGKEVKVEEGTENETVKEADSEEKKTEEAIKEKPRRSVLWKNTEGLPLDVVFDPVQSREAVVTISIAPPAEDGEESEPVKEFRIPVASLFQKGSINRWYVLKKVEHVHVDKAAVTEVADEDESTKEKTVEAEETEKTEEAEKTEETTKTAETAEADEKKETTEETASTEEKKTDEAETAESAGEETEEKADEEPVVEMPTAPHQTPVSAEATVESEDKVVVVQEGKLHVQVHFTMSEIEKLSQTAIALSQQKQEAEAVLAVLDREASSLRVKYERLNASQRSLSAGGVVKPRSTLLGGRGLGSAVARVEKSTYQKVKDSVAGVLTPQRTQVLTSFAIFCGSVALFHFQGDNLLA